MGMYDQKHTAEQTWKSLMVLTDDENLEANMMRVINEWPKAAAQNLCTEEPASRSWLGQATCCLVMGSPAVATREAWGMMTETQRRIANRIADDVIRLATHWNCGARGLFDA